LDVLRCAVFDLDSWNLMTFICRNKECVEILWEKKISVIQHTGPFLNPRMGRRKSVMYYVLYKDCPRSVKVKRHCICVM